MSAAPVRDPGCYGIASGGFQRGDLITPDRLSARGRLSAAVCVVWVVFDCQCAMAHSAKSLAAVSLFVTENYTSLCSVGKYLSTNTVNSSLEGFKRVCAIS